MKFGKNLSLFTMLALAFLFLCGAEGPSEERDDLIGQPAQEWQVREWMNSNPLQLKDLRGKIVLVRFWTAPHCPFCAASASALNEFYEKYHDQGLEVIGFYHHKLPAPLEPKAVQRYAEEFGFKFPVAIDYDWKTLKNWWLDADDRRWTSISFLIDKNGMIRHIHSGGQYVKGDSEYAQMDSKVQELLREEV
ncbi:MAG: alkyl hydroperoxide reductase [Omnitrophica bacterium RIFCSPHIGHO2_02_FULL_46_11]|nr:MAG: alkyl hydroperoxide reductase [Omnitrophica bacterium RIFCSPHIGHO2_02_FULL_46_11]